MRRLIPRSDNLRGKRLDRVIRGMGESTIRIKCQGCRAHTIISITPGTPRAAACPLCGSRLVEFDLPRGFVYILSHPHMPNLLKIGFTTRQVEERVAELNAATSAPGPFVIEGVFPSSEPELHESAAHETLAAVRLESKEFFKIDLVEAIRTVSAICGPASYLRTAAPPPPPRPRPSLRHRTASESHLSPADETQRLREWQERMLKK